MIQNLSKLLLSFPELIRNQIEQTAVKTMIPKNDSRDCAQDIVIVADKAIAALGWWCKGGQTVVIHNSISQQF